MKYVDTHSDIKQAQDKQRPPAGPSTSKGKNAAERNVVLAYYKGPSSSKPGDDFTFEILQGLLGEQLARNGFGLSIVPNRQGCESAKQVSRRFDLMIVGSGPLLSKTTLCVINNFINKSVLLLGPGFGQYNPVLKKYKTLQAFKQADIRLLLDNDMAKHDKIWQELPNLGSNLVGGIRGTHTKRVIGYLSPSDTTLPVIGDLGLLAADYYKEDNAYSITKRLGIPKGEKFFLYNAAICPGRRYNLESGKVQSEFEQAVIDLAGRYHTVVYAIGKCEPNPSFIEQLKKSSDVTSDKPGAEDNRNKMIFLSKIPDVPVLGKLFKEAYFSVNHLQHLDYFSTSYGTPFLPIFYSMEDLDLIESLDIAKYTVMIHRAKTAEIIGKINRITHDGDKIKSRMADLKTQTVKNYHRMFEMFSSDLSKRLSNIQRR